jgi:alkyldihydroxyacetonephosphate synthase
MWTKGQIWRLQGDPHRFLPDAVVWPKSQEEVSKILKLCGQHEVPVIPYGGGSGKCGGTVPVKGGVVLDAKRMNRILSIDPISCTVTTECGVIGTHLEQTLNTAGFTLGHNPPDMVRSTIGGWLATRSAGQFASRFGKIEDMVLDAEFVDGQGRVWNTAKQRNSGPGVPLLPLILGSEGILGVFTEVTLRIHPLTPCRAYRSIEVPNISLGLTLLRDLAQNDTKPLFLQLYDPLDTYLSGLIGKNGLHQKSALPTGLSGLIQRLGKEFQSRVRGPQEKLQSTLQSYLLAYPTWTNRLVRLSSESCLLVVGYEGEEHAVTHSMNEAARMAEARDGQDLGMTAKLSFLELSQQAAFRQPLVYKMGGCIDVLEVATSFENTAQLYEKMMQALSELTVVMAHFGHTNNHGCSINFTFAMREKDATKLEERHNRVWRNAMKVVSDNGGVLAHHRGVGLAKRDWIASEIGAGVDMIRAIKRVLDPQGIMNPGTLIP